MIKRICNILVDFIYPPVCHLCNRRLAPGEKYVCAHCLYELPRTLYHRHSPNAMELRFAGHFPFERATSLCFYTRTSKLSELVKDFKYRKFPGLAEHLGKIMASELLPTGFFDSIDIIIPVAMYRTGHWQRGYNQAESLAKGIASTTGIPIGNQLVAKKKHKTQITMTQEQRYRNLDNVFSVRNATTLAGKHILLVDDVCTTGATLTQSALSLLTAAPTARLSLLTLGVTF